MNKSGFIFCGYPAIGKSSISRKSNGYIDLESSYFHEGNNPDNWHKNYCSVAENLSMQGYNVFTSSHSSVIKEFIENDIHIVIIAPSISIKDDWISRLKTRYRLSRLEKDKRAYERALNRFDRDIECLQLLFLQSSSNVCNFIEIQSINYDLKNILDSYIKGESEK